MIVINKKTDMKENMQLVSKEKCPVRELRACHINYIGIIIRLELNARQTLPTCTQKTIPIITKYSGNPQQRL